jgi:hypothetical protein
MRRAKLQLITWLSCWQPSSAASTYEWSGSTQAVSEIGRCNNPHGWTQLLIDTVVPSNMNPVGEEGNLFSALFDKVPAKRAGNGDDIAGTVLYLVSRAGVSLSGLFGPCPFTPAVMKY